MRVLIKALFIFSRYYRFYTDTVFCIIIFAGLYVLMIIEQKIKDMINMYYISLECLNNIEVKDNNIIQD